MAKPQQQAYQEMTKSLGNYANNKVTTFIYDTPLLEDTFVGMISVGIIDVVGKEVIYNLDAQNEVLRFYYVDNGTLVKVVLDKKGGNTNYTNVKAKPYLISANGKMDNGKQVINSVDIYYSSDLSQSINIQNPVHNKIDFAKFINKL